MLVVSGSKRALFDESLLWSRPPKLIYWL